MKDYSGNVALARKLIDKFGRTVTVEKSSNIPADSNREWRGESASATLDVSAVLLDFDEADIDGTAVKRGDKRALVAPPTTGEDLTGYETLVDEGRTWRIESVQVLRPGSATILYTFQLRS